MYLIFHLTTEQISTELVRRNGFGPEQTPLTFGADLDKGCFFSLSLTLQDFLLTYSLIFDGSKMIAVFISAYEF